MAPHHHTFDLAPFRKLLRIRPRQVVGRHGSKSDQQCCHEQQLLKLHTGANGLVQLERRLLLILKEPVPTSCLAVPGWCQQVYGRPDAPAGRGAGWDPRASHTRPQGTTSIYRC